MLKHSLIALAFSGALTLAANAAAITWGATIDNGLSSFSGSDLAIGNYALLGSFNVTDSVIQQNQNDLVFLQSHFTLFSSAQIGDGTAVPSLFSKSFNLDTTALAGTQLYYWVLKSTNNSTVANALGSASEEGIFYVDKAVNPQWALPVEGIGASISNDLSDLTNAAGSALATGNHIVVGSFPKGASAATGSPNFGLATLTPEPSSAMLIGMGALGLLARRRRNS